MNVLIAGAGGILGTNLVKRYLEKGDNVTAMVLKAAEMRGLQHKNLKIIEANVTRPETIAGICTGQNIVISCIGITRIKEEVTHEVVDYKGNLNLIDDAVKNKIGKFGFISPAGTDDGKDEVPLLNAKYKLEEDLKKSGLKWVIFRSGGFFSDLAETKKMALKGPLFVIGDGTQRSTPIAVEDLADLMVADMAKAENEMINVGGPEDLSWLDICRITFDIIGKPPRIMKIPIWLCRFTLVLLKPFTFKYYAMGALLLFMSTRDIMTPRRGKMKLSAYLRAG